MSDLSLRLLTMDYRHPIDPMLVILIAYAVTSCFDRRRARQASLLEPLP